MQAIIFCDCLSSSEWFLRLKIVKSETGLLMWSPNSFFAATQVLWIRVSTMIEMKNNHTEALIHIPHNQMINKAIIDPAWFVINEV